MEDKVKGKEEDKEVEKKTITNKDEKFQDSIEKDESKITSNLRKNPYIAITFALAIFIVVIIVGNILDNKTIDKTEGIPVNISNQILCSVISATPAWANVNGQILDYGVIIPQNQSVDLVGQALIPDRIKFLYTPGCSACQAQINYFKEQGTWDAYVQENLTVNCNEV